MNPYDYQRNGLDASLYLKEAARYFRCYNVQWDGEDLGYSDGQRGVLGEYYLPFSEHRLPLAILVHGMGDPCVIPCRLLARMLAKKGIACFVLYLPVHSSRIPEAMKDRLTCLTAEEWFDIYRVSVVNIRQVIDWAGSRPEIDGKRIAAFGISLGGLVSAIAMGVDNRIQAGAFVVTGGNSEKMAWLSKSVAYAKYQRTETEYYRR